MADNTITPPPKLAIAIGQRIIARLADTAQQPTQILTLSLYPDAFSKMLIPYYPQCSIYALSIPQLSNDTRSNQLLNPGMRTVNANPCHLPLANHSVDSIISSLVLHHYTDYMELLFAELSRVLKPEGSLVFAMFAPGRHNNMQQTATHKIWPDLHAIGDAMSACPALTSLIVDQETVTVNYPDQAAFLHSMTTLAINTNTIAAESPLPNLAQSPQNASKTQATRTSMRYEIIYGHARKKHLQQQNAETIIPLDTLHQALKQSTG